MPSGDIVVDSAVDIADASPAATSHLHSASTEFLYLPSGEILAKPSSYHAGSSVVAMPPPMIDIPSSRYASSMYHHPPSTSAASPMSLQEQALSPSSNVPRRRGHHGIDTENKHGTAHAYQQRILELETLLQNEKKRSLDKMRLLLDEQDKSHDLQTRFSSLQTKIKTLEATISRHDTHTRDLQASVAAANARQASLVHEISDKTKHVDKLTQDLATAQKTNALLLANTQPAASRPSPPLPTVATSYTQTEAYIPSASNQVLSNPHNNPESLESSSIPTITMATPAAIPSTASPATIPPPHHAPTPSTDAPSSSTSPPPSTSSMESVLDAIRAWKDMADAWSRNPPVTSTSSSSLDALLGQFPALPRRIPSELGPSKDAAAVAMLQRRLALVDKEYRITHTKYIELKELCARQCVREADLQNFVNEHRLRGQCSLRLPSSTTGPNITSAAAPGPSLHDAKEHAETIRRPMDGHVKVVIRRRDQSTVDDSRAPPKNQTTIGRPPPLNVVASKELMRRHQRIPTPRHAKQPKKATPAIGRPWV
ncbi:hypothetical protein H257_07114 [Aphanomyces astaci]|uniref:Uncharacterized protein n=1 Tax=Aphanomyces astaci TaxID=112090 RepID=W4GJN2_APHAT|nr:hypothetical protein H257_07114 [Aphanomyces astaci]ETV79907.1 hypothetical protein H257_07114 [Aphanomyces astaci]|eukprot:XP_009830843.1 hypothetical protein H257_07114 [Aphanomyces astaci]